MELDILGGIFGGGSTGRKRKMRYAVKVKGVTISRHSTLSLARKAARGKRASISAIGKGRAVSFRSRRRVRRNRRY